MSVTYSGASSPSFDLYDDPLLLEQLVVFKAEQAEVRLAVEGMRCAGCACKLEQGMNQLAGVVDFEVELAADSAKLAWEPAKIRLSEMLRAISELGFSATPLHTTTTDTRDERDLADLLRRLGIAALLTMQIMMLSLADYFGSDTIGAERGINQFMHWIALALTLPVLLYSAKPLFISAWRALAARRVSMEVPVCLALLLAFGGSVVHTVLGSGTLYFDSVAMFVSFLLTSRYLEKRAQFRASSELNQLQAVVPDLVTRVVTINNQAQEESVPLLRLRSGDLLRVKPGDVIAADGILEQGRGHIDCSILNGESAAVDAEPGMQLQAGTLNLDGMLDVRVTATGSDSYAGRLSQLVRQASNARLSDDPLTTFVSKWFVIGVLLTATVTALCWALIDPARWFEATLAVLVASCPCALAIAKPAANAVAHAQLLSAGVAILKRGALETLPRVRHVLFDKTGTLTRGRPALTRVEVFNGNSRQHALKLAASLAQTSNHPLSRALSTYDGVTERAAEVRDIPGFGVAAEIDGATTLLGSCQLMTNELSAQSLSQVSGQGEGGQQVWLARAGELVARFEFEDELRDDASAVVASLKQAGTECHIASGDIHSAVVPVATAVGIKHIAAALKPEEKLTYLRQLQNDESAVAMVGDGLNDGPVIAAADVSFAMANAAALTQHEADIMLLRHELGGLMSACRVAQKLRLTIRQNLTWAVSYNLLIIPFAAMGLVAPWGAALGMSLSSLLVVANAFRIKA